MSPAVDTQKGCHKEFRNSPLGGLPRWTRGVEFGTGNRGLKTGCWELAAHLACGVAWHFPARSSLLINAAHGKAPQMEMSGVCWARNRTPH